MRFLLILLVVLFYGGLLILHDLCSIWPQTIARLQELLDADGITYSVKLFESMDSISGLGDEPFVS